MVPWHFSGHGQHLRPPFGYGAGTTTPLFPIARESLFFCSDGDRGFIAAVAPSRVVLEQRNGASVLPLGRPGVWFSPCRRCPSGPVAFFGSRPAPPPSVWLRRWHHDPAFSDCPGEPFFFFFVRTAIVVSLPRSPLVAWFRRDGMVRARFLLEDPGFGSPPAVDARRTRRWESRHAFLRLRDGPQSIDRGCEAPPHRSRRV